AANITGVGFKGACFINGACTSVKSVKFGSHDVNAGTFHVMNDTRIKVDSTPENRVCSYIIFCNDDPGLANVTVVSTVCYASSGKCNDYSSGFWCPTPVNQTMTPRCNQFKYIQRDQQLICSSKAPGGLLPFGVPSIGVDFKALNWK